MEEPKPIRPGLAVHISNPKGILSHATKTCSALQSKGEERPGSKMPDTDRLVKGMTITQAKT